MFTRVFSSILDSSLNVQSVPLSARWLWITMLLIADDDQTGVVDMPTERMAARAGLSVEQTREALTILGAPDPESSSCIEEGRRIVPLRDGARGWRLVNWEKYRQIATAEHKRALTRERVARHRRKGGDPDSDDDETERGPETALESTNATPPIPTHVSTPDFALAAGICAKIEQSGLKSDPPPQLVVAWITKYGPELIVETIEDCLGHLSGKHFNYLADIIATRYEDPSQRPTARRRGKGAAPREGRQRPPRNAGSGRQRRWSGRHFDSAPERRLLGRELMNVTQV